MTFLERYNAAKTEIDEKAKSLAVDVLGKIPLELFAVGGGGRNYDPETWLVTDIHGRSPNGTYFNKRPSKNAVTIMEEAASAKAELDGVFIGIVRTGAIGRTSASAKLSVIGDMYFLTKQEAEKKACTFREKYICKADQFNCKYCSVATDNDLKITSTVIARQYPNMRAEFDYCSSRCASYDQMAHEG